MEDRMSEANEPLSEREIEILRLVATGASNKEIALALSISPNTVKVHLRNIFTKIGVVSRTEATLYALKTGLVTPDLPPAAEDDTGAETLLPTIQDLNPLPEQSGFSRRTWIIITSAALLVAVVALILWFSRPAPAAVQPTTSVTLAVAPRWQTAEKLPQPHSGAAYATYSGALYLFGGQTAQGVSAATLIYSDSQGWTNGKDKPTPVAQAKAVLIGERIYLAGGSGADGNPVNVLEVYDPRADAWESRASLPNGISQYALAAYEGSLYLFGGWDGSATLDSVYRYSPTDDRWEARAALPQPLAFAAAVT
ncbi:MAG: hypothetical protein HY835_13760, partial [Anaerolineae bacterium]|nr:hypothetical protein [Anaerolineae bacterium]